MENSQKRFFNRDLSWLDFNDRVLFQSRDRRNPLLERIRFLSIVTSNLDEFVMKRIGYLKRVVARGTVRMSPDGLNTLQSLAQIRERILKFNFEREYLFKNELVQELALQGVKILDWDDLTLAQKDWAREYFKSRVFPILTPLVMDPAHPFPFISNLSLSLGVKIKSHSGGESHFARVKIPKILAQWIRVGSEHPSSEFLMIRLSDLVKENLDLLFPEMIIENSMPFRITRSADVEQNDDEAEDITEIVEEELRLRRLGQVVRVELKNPDPWMIELLSSELGLSSDDFYELPGEINALSLSELAALPLDPKNRFAPAMVESARAFLGDPDDIFQSLRESDHLLHHPQDSFSDSVVRFLKAAADDPKVLAIKMTLYRTGDASPFIRILAQAARAGKQVVCVVELKARFDEERNISSSEILEEAGVHVVYGVVGLKTHSKIALVVRQEDNDFRFYGHIGTGNYNPETAKIYTDVSLFTADPKVTRELIEIFNFLTGLSKFKNYKRFLVSPVNMRHKFMELIENEISNAKTGKPARIVAKMNSLEDISLCEQLYLASAAGVSIDLIVRGFCNLRPGVAGLSENIRVSSLVGRYLQHSRIFYFQAGADKPADGKFFIGSADWMYRNFNKRFETAVAISDRNLRKKLWEILESCLNEKTQRWVLSPSGEYKLGEPPAEHLISEVESFETTAQSKFTGSA